MTPTITLSSQLLPYKKIFEESVKQWLSRFEEKNAIWEIVQKVILGDGKRLRPAIVLMVADALGNKRNVVPCALAVELFHTASLIVDDLPCMDNSAMRRGKAALHKECGEAATILTSYALIAEGYSQVTKNSLELQELVGLSSHEANLICRLGVETIARNMGVVGATNGQFLDLFPPEKTCALYREVAMKKTVSLFEIAFALGWLFGGGDKEQLGVVKRAATCFGMAFQIHDDFDDVEQDLLRPEALNLVALVGGEEATKLLEEEIEGYQRCLKELQLDHSSELKSLALLLSKR